MNDAVKNPLRRMVGRRHTKPRRRHTFIFMGFMMLFTLLTGHHFTQATLERSTADLIGFLLIIVCVAGRTYSSLFVAGRKNGRVVREGMYSVVRNPLYVFSFLGVVGIGLQSGKVTVLAMLVLSFMYYYDRLVRKEERYLTQHFGAEYTEYCRLTPRWIPDFALWNVPAEITVQPKLILRTITDCSLFCGPLCVFRLVELAQQWQLIVPYADLF